MFLYYSGCVLLLNLLLFDVLTFASLVISSSVFTEGLGFSQLLNSSLQLQNYVNFLGNKSLLDR